MGNDVLGLAGIVADIGVGATIAIYLVYWMTRKMNGKLDRLAESIEKLNHNIEKLYYIFKYKCGGEGKNE